MPTQTLQIVGHLQPELGAKYARITHDHGDGYLPSELIGHEDGVLFYRYVFQALPNRSTHTVTDPEDGDAVKTWQSYLHDFFDYRQADGAPFEVADQRTGATVLVIFASNQFSETLSFKSAGRCEIRLRQYREADD